MRVFVKAKPNSKENRMEKIDPPMPRLRRTNGAHFMVSVKEPPVQGRANRAIINLLADHFSVLPSQIKIISGHTSKQKIIEIL